MLVELAKVTTKGQITIPKAIRDFLQIKEESKIIFLQKGNDKIQDAFDGEAKRLGLETEEDVVKMVKEYRRNKK